MYGTYSKCDKSSHLSSTWTCEQQEDDYQPSDSCSIEKKRLKSTMISTEILHHFAGYVNGMKMYGVMSELELRAHWIIF